MNDEAGRLADLLSRTRRGDANARQELFDTYREAAESLLRHRGITGLSPETVLQRIIDLHENDTVLVKKPKKG